MKHIPVAILCSLAVVPLRAQTPCIGGMAAGYPCDQVDLMSFVPNTILGAGELNDCWGWTDPANGKEYALVGGFTGTVFVDITDPVFPVVIGRLPTHTVNSIWRDIKVYDGHAFIVSEASSHGLQVFDLARLDTVTAPPVVFTENAHSAVFGKAHNIAIDEESAMAYVVGSNICNGGLAMFNIQNPQAPVYVGCFSQDGYTHDTQCVIYHGPDVQYQGRRICFASNADTFTIVDVDDPTDPMMLSRTGYAASNYTHQGWLSEDHRFFFMGDEGDEQTFGTNTRTFIWDVSDLDAPPPPQVHTGTTRAIDHNLYTHAGIMYQANYRAGLQVLDIDPLTGALGQVAYFDVFPTSNTAQFNGAWSVYPYFASGNVIVSGIEQGLFVLRPPVISRIKLKAFLQGPYNATLGLMHDSLRVQGAIPLNEPYTALGYDHVGGGGESIGPGILAVTGGNAIVDWVVVELRDKTDPTVIVATRSALIQRDGDVVNANDASPLTFPMPMGLYRVAVRHRNHLGILSKGPLPLGPSNYGRDLSNGTNALYGPQAAYELGGRLLMWSGNVLADGLLKYTGEANDRDPILVAIGGAAPTNTATGYHVADVNMDGEVKYTGSNNDRDPILFNVGGSVPTQTRTEQIP